MDNLTDQLKNIDLNPEETRILLPNDTGIKCPTEVLKESCGYFSSLLNFHRDSSEIDSRILDLRKVENFEADILKTFFDTLTENSSIDDIKEEEIAQLLEACVYFDSEKLAKRLIEKSDISTLNWSCYLTQAPGCISLVEKCKEILFGHYASVARPEEINPLKILKFEESELKKFLEVLSDEHLRVSMIFNWAFFDPGSRSHRVKKLIRRLPKSQLIDPRIKEIFHTDIDSLEICHEPIKERAFLSFDRKFSKLTIFSAERTKIKKNLVQNNRFRDYFEFSGSSVTYVEKSNSVYIVGGVNNKKIIVYNLDKESWSAFPYCNERIRPSLIYCETTQRIYILGGCSSLNKDPFNSSFESTVDAIDVNHNGNIFYNVEFNKFIQKSGDDISTSSSLTNRNGAPGFCRDRSVYIFGGMKHRGKIDTKCYALNFETRKVRRLPDLPFKVGDLALCRIGPNLVYFIGRTEENEEKIFLFDCENEIWIHRKENVPKDTNACSENSNSNRDNTAELDKKESKANPPNDYLIQYEKLGDKEKELLKALPPDPPSPYRKPTLIHDGKTLMIYESPDFAELNIDRSKPLKFCLRQKIWEEFAVDKEFYNRNLIQVFVDAKKEQE